MLGHWFDTVNRQRRRAEMFGYWLDSRSSERDTKAFGHWLDRVDRQRRSIETFFTARTHQIIRERVLRRLVTGLTQ